MKHNILAGIGVVGIVVGGIVGIGMFLYVIFGFMTWLFSDPFDFLPDNLPVNQYVDPDVQACRDKGGLAIKSLWDGRLKRCENLPK